jgi:hypothetical protein
MNPKGQDKKLIMFLLTNEKTNEKVLFRVNR